jgi:uncharacterized SAM-binding protein YcdF (DUF218 family)
VVSAVLLFFFSGRILWALGAWLVDSENPRKADVVVTLGGEFSGRRVLKGAELVREGFAPKLVISNGPLFYGRPESEIAADFAAARGYDRSAMICIQNINMSTMEEARTITPMLRNMGAHSVLLVTSPSHTARATRVFRQVAPDLEFHPVAAPDPHWCGGQWWTNRDCEKTWLFEAMKTVTEKFGI